MKISDFNADLIASIEAEKNHLVALAIQKHFPDSLVAHRCHIENDKLGADLIIERLGNKPVLIDLKTRKKDYAKHRPDIDIALELTNGNNLGWAIKKPFAEYFLFVCMDTGRSACFKSHELRNALERHAEFWATQFRTFETATNGQYGTFYSKAIVVPASVIETAIAHLDEGA